MTKRQIELVENSWDFIILNSHEAGMTFYSKLFELDPSLRPLFRGDMKSQAQKLTSLITFAVHKLHDIDEIISDVKALGVRHKKYKVKSEYYVTVAEALLWTLSQELGSNWNEETQEAWVKLYETLSKIMIQAANEDTLIEA